LFTLLQQEIPKSHDDSGLLMRFTEDRKQQNDEQYAKRMAKCVQNVFFLTSIRLGKQNPEMKKITVFKL